MAQWVTAHAAPAWALFAAVGLVRSLLAYLRALSTKPMSPGYEMGHVLLAAAIVGIWRRHFQAAVAAADGRLRAV